MTNVFKSFGDLIWGDSTQKTIFEINSGQFYCYTPRGDRPIIYVDAKAAIHRISQPFIFQLTIYRVTADEDEDLDNGTSHFRDDMKFTIAQDMEFHQGVVAGATAFTWKRTGAYDDGSIFEFVCDEETSNFNVNSFELTIYQCMYQFKYKKSPVSASEQDLLQFKIAASRSRSLSAPAAPSFNTRVKKPPTTKQPTIMKESVQSLLVSEQRMPPSNAKRIADFPGELMLWDDKSSLFVSHWRDSTGWLLQEQLPSGRVLYWFAIIRQNGTRQVIQQLEHKMNPIFSLRGHTFTWDDNDESTGKCYTWQFRFRDNASWDRFRNLYGRSMYEIESPNVKVEKGSSSQHPQSSLVETSQEYYDAEGYEDESETSDEEDLEEEEEFDGDEKMPQFVEPNDNSRNSQLAVGYKDRSFVVRGSKIGVFSHNERDGLDFQTTIKNLSNSSRKILKPSKVLLHEEDRAMVMMDPSDLHTAYKMDLEYGRIVEEWDLSGTSGVLDLVSSSKYAQRTGGKTMVGISKDAMFRIDSRQQRNKIVQAEFKQYAASNHFACGTTTADGSLAVAGAKGDIKLFNVIGKIAKTALPSHVSSVIGLDVTANGRYVLATCKSCILVIDVLNPANNELGFNYSFPANAKPVPVLLTLKPEHVAAMKTPLSFTPARFNMGINEEEKTIVTSTGPYVITWNFRRVKLGHTEYQIKEYADRVVADNFKYGQDRSIIVTLPNDVTSVHTRNMRDSTAIFGRRS